MKNENNRKVAYEFGMLGKIITISYDGSVPIAEIRGLLKVMAVTLGLVIAVLAAMVISVLRGQV